MTLPVVLEDYGEAVIPQLSRLGGLIGSSGTQREQANGFLAALRAMSASLSLPNHLSCIRSEDIPSLAAQAAAEANPLYPVPVIYDKDRFYRIMEQLRRPQP